EGELNACGLHAEVCGVLHLLVDVRRHQQLLRRNAATQAARAAESLVLLYERGFQTQLPRAHRGHVAAGAGAYDRHVELFGRQSVLSSPVRDGPRLLRTTAHGPAAIELFGGWYCKRDYNASHVFQPATKGGTSEMKHSAGFLKIVDDAKTRVRELDVAETRERLAANPQARLIDVREDNEWQRGHAAGAEHL